MSGLLLHRKVSTVGDGPDPAKVQPTSDWNDDHVFGGGNKGSILLRDTSVANYGASWLQSVAVGSVMVSAGIGSLPAWSASPTLTNLTLGGALISGAIPSGAGAQRMSNNSGIYWRNAADNADLRGIFIAGDNNIYTDTSFVPGSPNTYDIGLTGTKWRTGYFGTSLVVGTNPATLGGLRLPNATTDANAAFVRGRNFNNNADVTLIGLNASDHHRIDFATQATIGANGAASALTANPVGYIVIDISGTERIIPFYTK